MNKKILGIFLISLFILSTVPASFADDDKSYSIDLADIFLTVSDNGLLHVKETYYYVFDGEFNGVYRNIPLKSGESIDNLNVTTDGAYSNFKNEVHNDEDVVTTYLWADEGHTQKIRDTSVKVTYEYDFKNVIKTYNDVAELHYKLWGEQWDVGADKLKAHIQFNSSNGVEYWVNPYYVTSNTHWNGSTLEFETNDVNSGEYIEFRSVIPLDQFNNPVFANHINKNGNETIHEVQEEYQNSIERDESLINIVPLIALCILVIPPVLIYFRYGREPKTQYNGIYERELPTDDVPIMVDGLFSKNEDVGKVSKNGFQATVMDLINRKILTIDSTSNSENIILKYNSSENSSLKDYEMDIVNLLRNFEVDGLINFNLMESELEHESIARDFNDKYSMIISDFEKCYIDPIINDYFIDTGSTYMKIYAVLPCIIAGLFIFWGLSTNVPNFYIPIIIGVILIIMAIIIFLLPNRIGGRWTESGKESYDKWQAFNKYIEDYSLIKEYPPESIVIWNKYLVYATALGSADTVQKAMKDLVPQYTSDNDLYFYHYYGGYYMMDAMFTTAISSANPSSNDVGGIGGGSGGGGGGAF